MPTYDWSELMGWKWGQDNQGTAKPSPFAKRVVGLIAFCDVVNR